MAMVVTKDILAKEVVSILAYRLGCKGGIYNELMAHPVVLNAVDWIASQPGYSHDLPSGGLNVFSEKYVEPVIPQLMMVMSIREMMDKYPKRETVDG